MPTYIYKNPKTGEEREVIQGMNDEHKYEADGQNWQRIFESPNASIDTKWDPMDSRNFVEKTKTKRGTMGDLYDKAKELSQQREQIIGKDPLKEKVFQKYEKETGKKHPFRERKKEVKIDFSKAKVK